jgi:hypothetical protein
VPIAIAAAEKFLGMGVVPEFLFKKRTGVTEFTGSHTILLDSK